MTRWTTSLLGCMLAASAASGQTVKKAPSKAATSNSDGHPSTLDGVYTDAQARRGKDVYFGSCRSCHSAESHTGATFAQWWKGKQLSDLFVFIATKMPKNDPGSLAPEDAADVVAYLLKMNVMPVGKHDLPPDVDSLAKFRIDVKPAKRGQPANSSAASGSTSKGKKP
jgi:mono/diheme cytochrome c family protein